MLLLRQMLLCLVNQVSIIYVYINISRYQGNRVISGVLQILYFTLKLVINVISPVGLLMFTYHHLYN